jgi:hypothetical protein
MNLHIHGTGIARIFQGRGTCFLGGPRSPEKFAYDLMFNPFNTILLIVLEY